MENTGLPPHKELHAPNNSGTADEESYYTKPSWMMNESVFDTTWVIAKTGHALEDNENLTLNFSFAQKISHNELLTNKVHRPLLEDLRNSLLYLNTKGKITRAERTRDILKTACHLILHSNELQNLKNLRSIRSLAEISFEHVKDYLLAFNVEKHDFDKCLDIITLNNWNSRSELDWDLLERSTTLTTRQFASLKDKLIKYLDKHREGFGSEKAYGYIKQYPNACAMDFDIERDLAPKAKTISNEISKLHALYVARPSQKYKFRHAAQKLFSSGNTIFDDMVEADKTPLMPVATALHTLSSALHFVRTYGLALREYNCSLSKEEKAIIDSTGIGKFVHDFTKYQKMVFDKVTISIALKDLNLTSWRHESELCKNDFSNGISFTTAVKLYIASIWILIASFSTGRTTSLITLKRNCFVQSPIDGLFDLILRIPKSSERWELEEVHRPIPDLIYDYGLEFAAFSNQIESRLGLVRDDKESYLLTRTLNTRSNAASTYKVETNEHLKAFGCDVLGDCLDIFFDWIESPLTDGKRWYARTHQFRRFFAVLYFNLTDGEGLDELSWFMGHANLDQTFHYAEVAPTDEWIEEAELTIARIGASLNKHINADDEIRDIVDTARMTSNVSTIIEPLVKKLISEHKEKTNQEVRFCRIEGEDVFFYFSGTKEN